MACRLLPPDGSYERMTALDAAFLQAETDRAPLHVGAMSILEGGPLVDERGAFRLAEVRDHVAGRMHLLPRFRKRVAVPPYGQGRPVWVDHEGFRIDEHVLHVTLPPPGDEEQLARLCCEIQARPLGRRRPLWELWFVDGLEDGTVALVEKVHHAMVDGISGVDVAAALLDLEPDPAPLDVPEWRPVPPPTDVELLTLAELDRLRRPLGWLLGLRTELPDLVTARSTVDGLVDALKGLVAAPVHDHPLAGRIGHDRVLCWTTVPLEEVREAAHRRDATVNDAVLSAVGGGVRRVLGTRGTLADASTLSVLVPVSTRAPDERGRLGNRVSGVIAPVPIDEADPDARLHAVAAAMSAHKEHHQSTGVQLAVEGLEVLEPALMSVLARTIHHQPFLDVVVTNVPGPSSPLYFLGARLLRSVPIVPLGGNLTMGIAILSYAGDLTIGIYADSSAAEDAREVCRGIDETFDALRGTGTSADTD